MLREGKTPASMNSMLAARRIMNDQKITRWFRPKGRLTTRFWAKA
jgi:hypothetical protein